MSENVHEGIKGTSCYSSNNIEAERELLSCLLPTAGISFTMSLTGGDRCPQSFTEQCALWNSMESAQFLLNRSSWDSHPLLLASEASHKKFTHFYMTALQMFANNNLLPLQTPFSWEHNLRSPEEGRNLTILDCLL